MKLIGIRIKKIFDADNYCRSKLHFVRITSKGNMTILKFMFLKVILYTIIISFCTCFEEEVLKSTMRLVNFRKLVEETSAEKPSDIETLDSNNNFVSFLVHNAKEIFSNSDPTVILEPESENDETTVALSPTTVSIVTTKEITVEESMQNIISDLESLNDNTSDSTLPDIAIKNQTDGSLNTTDISSELPSTLTTTTINHTDIDITEKETITELRTTEEVLILEKKAIEEMNRQVQSDLKTKESTKRSCIACDNVASIDCFDPKNKLISSRVCDREEDLCYSMHTPFGIVDRGCYNVNHNLSTYVCSCNLCNYISISEMPYIFSGKRDWIENVKELSRTKRLRKSILKDMSCLRCEVNSTVKTGDSELDNANCLEGNLNALPMQECASHEICGVRAIRSEGYIWRGCLSKPLYNYWWALCDTDLCNYDGLVSIYDEN